MNIRTIKPAPKNPRPSEEQKSCRRVAAYARVSTDSTEQETSLEAQKDFFETFIKAHENWTFAGIYYDSGISGLSRRNRDGFNRMIEDALAGKIDLIITKSLSRFARNTVDTLTVIRKLKATGVEVFFQKENIYTMDSKGEFLLTLMSSIAQEESRSISENVTLGQRKRFSDGRYSVPYKRFMGYDQGGTNQLVANEEQAKVVRLIYRLYLGGLTEQKICKFLESHGISAPSGGINWHKNVICNILKNEKYKGDALLQKCYTADFLSKAIRKNQGELPQYYVEKGHSPIVSDAVFDLVQKEHSRRNSFHKQYSCQSVLSSKIICSGCGGFYGRKIAHSNDQYRKLFWRCNGFYHQGSHSPCVDDTVVRKACQTAVYELLQKYGAVTKTCALLLHKMRPDISTKKWLSLTQERLDNARNRRYSDQDTWRTIIDHITVSLDGKLSVFFIDGSQLYRMLGIISL